MRREPRHEVDVLADQSPKQRLQIQDDAVQVEDLRLQNLLAAEDEQLTSKPGCKLPRLDDLLDVGAELFVGSEPIQDDQAVTVDRRQQVVEVVGDAAGQPADRLHLLGLPEPSLELSPLAHVPGDHRQVRHLSVRVSVREEHLGDRNLTPTRA